jgi:hypothetical protein
VYFAYNSAAIEPEALSQLKILGQASPTSACATEAVTPFDQGLLDPWRDIGQALVPISS